MTRVNEPGEGIDLEGEIEIQGYRSGHTRAKIKKIEELKDALEKAQILVEKYAYPDSIGWADMDGKDVSKLWRILEDALVRNWKK